MSLDSSFVVLLAGYIFVMRCHLTRFVARQQDGYKTLFGSGVAGVVLLAVSYVVVRCLNWPSDSATLESVTQFLPDDLVGRSIYLSFLLSVVSVFVINRFASDRYGIRQAIDREGSKLEILLVKSMRESELVEVVLKGGTAFVGIVSEMDPPSNRSNHVELDQMLQGFVDSEGQTQFPEDQRESSLLILPIDEIQRAKQLT